MKGLLVAAGICILAGGIGYSISKGADAWKRARSWIKKTFLKNKKHQQNCTNDHDNLSCENENENKEGEKLYILRIDGEYLLYTIDKRTGKVEKIPFSASMPNRVDEVYYDDDNMDTLTRTIGAIASVSNSTMKLFVNQKLKQNMLDNEAVSSRLQHLEDVGTRSCFQLNPFPWSTTTIPQPEDIIEHEELAQNPKDNALVISGYFSADM